MYKYSFYGNFQHEHEKIDSTFKKSHYENINSSIEFYSKLHIKLDFKKYNRNT
jgi:hypothetical protein